MLQGSVLISTAVSLLFLAATSPAGLKQAMESKEP